MAEAILPPRIGAADVVSVLLGLGLLATIVPLGGMDPRWSSIAGGLFASAAIGLLFVSNLTLPKGALLGLPLLGWAILGACSWARDPVAATSEVVLWIQATLVFWWASAAPAHRLRSFPFWTILACVLFGAGAAFWQAWVQPGWLMLGRYQVSQYIGRSAGTFGNPNHFAALLLLCLPIAVAHAFDRRKEMTRRAGWIYLSAILLAALILTLSRGVWLAGAVVALAALLQRRRGFSLVFGAGIVLLLLTFSVPSLRERILTLQHAGGEPARAVLWRAAAELMGRHPFVGYGAGSFDVAFETVRPAGFRDEPGWVHQDYLQFLFEYGAVGLALLVGTLVFVFRRLRLEPRVLLGSAYSLALGGLALASLVDFHWHVPGVALPAAWFAGGWLRELSGRHHPSAMGRPLRVALGLFIAVALGLGAVRHYAEALRLEARRALDARTDAGSAQNTSPGDGLAYGAKLLERAAKWDPRNPRVWADRAYGELLAAERNAEDSRHALMRAECYARRATELAPEWYLPWLRLGVSLHAQGKGVDASEAFHQARLRAPAKAIVWFHYGRFLASRPSTQRLARTALEYSLYLDPTYGEAQALLGELSSH